MNKVLDFIADLLMAGFILSLSAMAAILGVLIIGGAV